MIFKVFYQKDAKQAPVRELTEALYVEGGSEAEIRSKLASSKYNIEFITEISGNHLEYEKKP